MPERLANINFRAPLSLQKSVAMHSARTGMKKGAIWIAAVRLYLPELYKAKAEDRKPNG